MKELSQKIADYKTVIAMPTDTAAFILLGQLQPLIGSSNNNFHWGNELSGWTYGLTKSNPDYVALAHSFMEAWSWLERRGLLVHSIQGGGDAWYSISRQGMAIKTEQDFAVFKHAELLPKDVLHPSIAGRVYGNYLVGDYDAAVLLAFKTVEVEVRKAGAYPDGLFGKELMKEAFNEHKGKLADMSLPVAERESIRDLFVGSIGYAKNPQSHREVGLNHPVEAAELIMLANHLLRIVESQKPKV